EITKKDKMGTLILENKNERNEEYEPPEDMVKQYQEFGIDIKNPTKISPYLRTMLAIFKYKEINLSLEHLGHITYLIKDHIHEFEYALSQLSEDELFTPNHDRWQRITSD